MLTDPKMGLPVENFFVNGAAILAYEQLGENNQVEADIIETSGFPLQRVSNDERLVASMQYKHPLHWSVISGRLPNRKRNNYLSMYSIGR